MVLILAYSQTEVIWNPFAVDGLTWIYVLLICGGLASVPRPTARPEPARRRHPPRVNAC